MVMQPLLLVLELARIDKAEDPFAFSFRPQSYLWRNEHGGYETVHIEWDHSLLSELEAVRRPGHSPAVIARLGEKLRGFLQPAGWGRIESEIRQAVQVGRSVLLTMRFAAAELYALPWELLTLRSTGQQLGELPHFLCHYEWPETETFPAASPRYPSNRRILLAWSAAGGAVPAADHVRAINEACGAGSFSFDDTSDVLPHASCRLLAEALEAAKREGRPFTVLHLLCHGGAIDTGFGLILDDSGASHRVASASTMRQILAPYADTIRLVVLCACDSGNSGNIGSQLGSVAQALHRAGFAQVVASRYPFSVLGSITLTQTLYQKSLNSKGALMNALLLARQRMFNDDAHHDWISVQLYARSQSEVFISASDPAAINQICQVYLPQASASYFTGRVGELSALHEALQEHRSVALWGLGGIGKTQIALAFAHQCQHEYAAVLWLIGDSVSNFEQGLRELAGPLIRGGQLNSIAPDERDPKVIQQAVLNYLRQATDYLLICDNVDSPLLLKAVWPRKFTGQVLITSRSQEVRRLAAVVLELGKLPLEDSQAYLMRCHPALSDEEVESMREIARELDGLPLALAQAAAYLVRHRSRYSAYLNSYRRRKLILLEKGLPDNDYPHSVATTWELSITEIGQSQAASLEMLKLCALLQADTISEELFAAPQPELGHVLHAVLVPQMDDELTLDNLLEPLLCHALMQRYQETRTLSLHRLVQQAILHRITGREREQLTKAAVAQLDVSLPALEFSSWPAYRQIVPHILALVEHGANSGLKTPRATRILYLAGRFLYTQAHNTDADALYRLALAIQEEILGIAHPDLARTLNALGRLLRDQGRLEEAEPLYRRALTIRENTFGQQHPDVAISLDYLAVLLRDRGELGESEVLHRRAMAILDSIYGPENPFSGRTLNALGLLMMQRNKLEEAEVLFSRALRVWQNGFGAEHPNIAYCLCNLAQVSILRDQLDAAELLYRRALAIREKALPAGHPLLKQVRTDLDALLVELRTRHKAADSLTSSTLG